MTESHVKLAHMASFFALLAIPTIPNVLALFSAWLRAAQWNHTWVL